jgi:uncharacterized protein (TIGR02001 family)
MKKTRITGAVLAFLAVTTMISPLNLQAQEESSSPFSVGGDLVSSYLWRGTKFGTGPAIQPYLELALGNFSIGGWGSYCFTTNEAAEADLYVSYGFDFGLSIGMTDYYFPGTPYFDYSKESGSHAFEVNLGYEFKGLSIAANYFLNEAGSAGTEGGDMYFELGYAFKNFGIFVGGGNGWHTVEANADESDFMVCNIGITASKEIKITDSFSLPVTGSLILNPDTEQFHVVVGISF